MSQSEAFRIHLDIHPEFHPDAVLNATGVAIDSCPITPHILYREFKAAGLIEE